MKYKSGEKMNNKSFLTFSIVLSILFVSCGFIPRYNTYIYIYDCEHGSLEVQFLSENNRGADFLITAYPENGYCLDINSLYIYNHPKGTDEYYIEPEKERIISEETNKENQFQFHTKKSPNITIYAFFTKK